MVKPKAVTARRSPRFAPSSPIATQPVKRKRAHVARRRGIKKTSPSRKSIPVQPSPPPSPPPAPAPPVKPTMAAVSAGGGEEEIKRLGGPKKEAILQAIKKRKARYRTLADQVAKELYNDKVQTKARGTSLSTPFQWDQASAASVLRSPGTLQAEHELNKHLYANYYDTVERGLSLASVQSLNRVIKRLPLETTVIRLPAGRGSAVVRMEHSESGFSLIFAAVVLQWIITDKIGGEYWITYPNGTEGYRVPPESFQTYLRSVIITPEFSNQHMTGSVSWAESHLLATFCGRPTPVNSGAYANKVHLWKGGMFQALMRRAEKRYGSCEKKDMTSILQLLFEETKESMKLHPNMTCDEALRIPRMGSDVLFTFWHFVTFAVTSARHVGYEQTFAAVLGILWRDMNCREEMNHPWARDTFPIADPSLPLLGYRETATPVEVQLWDSLAGLLEVLMFQDTKSDLHCFNTVQFDQKLFVSQPYIFFNTLIQLFLALERQYPSQQIAFERILKPEVHQQKVCPITCPNEYPQVGL